MLPEIRTNGDVFSIPKFSIVEQDIDSFINKLKRDSIVNSKIVFPEANRGEIFSDTWWANLATLQETRSNPSR